MAKRKTVAPAPPAPLRDAFGLIPEKSAKVIPPDVHCQEASPLSGNRYIPCGEDATSIINNGDRRLYYMCSNCAVHNIRNRAAKLLFTVDPKLQPVH